VPLPLTKRFKDRFDAARQLVQPLKKFARKPNVVLLAIPRGALQIGSFLSHELKLPLDVVLVKKIPAPTSEELAIGAVSSDGGQIVDDQIVQEFRVPPEYITAQRTRITKLLEQKEGEYHKDAAPIAVAGKTVIVLDDGIATGYTVRAAIEMLRQKKVARTVVATPASSQDAADIFSNLADEFISLRTEKQFYAVGMYYVNFPQVEDHEAVRLLVESRK
jgi:putative phosphoribosyl transferase